MSIISAGDTGGVDLPEISNSLRFDGSNDYLIRSSWASANRKTWVWSGWVKRSKLGVEQAVFGAYDGVSTYASRFYFTSTDALAFDFGYAAQNQTITAALFRDPSAFYHIQLVLDTTQTQTAHSTSTSRIRIYVNGVQQTTSGFIPSQNLDTQFFINTLNTFIGTRNLEYFSGYMANVLVINGSAVDPSSFAYADPNGQWRSLSKTALQAVVNAGGANSFFLSFDNGTSTTTLGADASSKGNNWTLTNMVRSAGASDCWSFDTPTNNHATLNPLHTGRSTITNGALTASGATDLPTIVPDSGTWYFEISGVSKTWTPPAAFPASAGDYNFGQRAFTNTATNPTLSIKNLPGGSVTTSGSFTGNVAADGPFVWINGTPTAMTINGNAVTFGTHADKLANGFKLRTASTSYNNSGSNTYSVTSNAGAFKYNNAEGNP